MRKTKKILAGILTAAMLMSTSTAWAGPSITDKVVVVEDSVGNLNCSYVNEHFNSMGWSKYHR